MSAPNAEKGARYLASLDQALCNGNWAEVPELARKTDKHAPDRKCLTLTARSEAQIASASHRPTSASSSPTGSIHGLSELVPRLEEAVAVGNSIEEDAFVASVCLAEIHWLRNDHAAALRALPEYVPRSNTLSSLPSAIGWLEVCRVKTTYIRASSLESGGNGEEVGRLWQQAIVQTPGSRTPELRRWTERLLGRACMYYYGLSTSSASISTLSESLRVFGAWSDFWQRAASGGAIGGPNASRLDTPRRQVWRAYYDVLSTVLQHGLMYHASSNQASGLVLGPPDSFPEEYQTAAKMKQRADLKRVESTYETLLINETQFPKATENNREIEEWVEQAMLNWRIICGTGWTDAELGHGGKESASRNMLDILYRASTKTFHSTAILRELFSVHASVGEFDLAMHAFDSYVEIVGKGKARAEKTGEHELGLDDDDTAMLTAAEAVRILCRYGDREQAEKAVEVGKNMQKWLGQQRPTSSSQTVVHSDNDNPEIAHSVDNPTDPLLRPTTLAAAYRAIGVSIAHWAGLTYETDSRSILQAEALEQLKRSQAQDPESIETAYALALLLAETRDVTTAISVIRKVLAPSPATQDASSPDHSQEKKLLPLWHLLALCLTAKDQHEPAIRMCEVAFEQFGDPSVLFGRSQPRSSDPEKQVLSSRKSIGLVDQMEPFEKETILQIKMSQLTFIELTEGPSVAVDMTDELLSLYARLFGSPEQTKALAVKPPQTAVSVAPSRGGGTLRSIAGSIRPRTARNSVETEKAPPITNGATDGTSSGPPIAITVTNEDGKPAEQSRGRHEHRHLPFHFRHSGGRSRSRSAAKETKPALDGNAPPYPSTNNESAATTAHATSTTAPQVPPKSEQPLKPMAHNESTSVLPAPTGHDFQPPRQDVRLPAPHPASHGVPEPRFPFTQQRRHKISLLVKIWLFIAELYIRAEALDDATGAVEEAQKLVEAFEAEVATTSTSGIGALGAREFWKKGWGGGKAVDGLWADVWSAKGDLASSHNQPFDAMAHYEQSLAHYPDHASSIIALSDLLMDLSESKIPPEAPHPPLPASSSTPSSSRSSCLNPNSNPTANTFPTNPSPLTASTPTPAHLNKLAAQNRAYMLLSTLTRLGSGWDNSQAWLALARNYELSGQIGRAKEALWWVIELEDQVPTREWRVVGGGYAFAL